MKNHRKYQCHCNQSNQQQSNFGDCQVEEKLFSDHKKGDRVKVNVNVDVNINGNADKMPCEENGVSAYPPVSIINSTPFDAFGTVEYATIFCSNDNYVVTPSIPWTASGRGVCLVTEISATVRTPSGDVRATPYTSSGTSFSQFAIIQTGDNQFEVTRRVSGSE